MGEDFERRRRRGLGAGPLGRGGRDGRQGLGGGLFGPATFRGGNVRVYGCAPGCLIVSLLLSVFLTILLNLLIRAF